MCISYLGQKVTTWVSRDHGDHLGQTQVITSYYLGQSYYLGRNIYNTESDSGQYCRICFRRVDYSCYGMAPFLAVGWESFVVEWVFSRGVAITGYRVAMFSCGVAILSRGVVVFSHGVVILSRGLAMFGRGVVILSHGVAMFGRGVVILSHGVAMFSHGVAILSRGVSLV